MAIHRRNLRFIAIAIIALGIIVAILDPSGTAAVVQIPLFAVYSTTRMVLAYILSLIFAIAYGTTMATNRRASEILLPVLDILQSVPILAFFPIVLLFFVRNLPSPLGPEFSVIFLIFTSMAWNMAFGVYEALTTLPQDLSEASSVFGLRGWFRFRRLQFPATIPKLVYNSILSWSVGWFYLVASEVFTAFGSTFKRPGLGSYLFDAGQAGDIGAIVIGLAALTTVVVVLDTFIWRPLSVWAERFRLDVSASGDTQALHARPPIYVPLGWLPRFSGLRQVLTQRVRPVARRWVRVATNLDGFYSRHPRTIRAVRRVDLVMFAVIFLILVVTGVIGLAELFVRSPPPGTSEIPIATLTSLGRLALAYAVCLAWTIPFAAWLGRSKRASRYFTPVIEVVASVPATALFPILILFSLAIAASREGAAETTALFISIFAMQWYLLFNLLAGVRSIPADLDEATKVFGVRGWTYWRRVLFPAMIPSLLTGSITAWGAGWNALIVAEYIPYGTPPFTVSHGLGALIDAATYGGSLPGVPVPIIGGTTDANNLLYLSILFMIVVVLAMNKVLWRPLIKRTSLRFRYEV
jgi:NitT/TauT family transport system permease protein